MISSGKPLNKHVKINKNEKPYWRCSWACANQSVNFSRQSTMSHVLNFHFHPLLGKKSFSLTFRCFLIASKEEYTLTTHNLLYNQSKAVDVTLLTSPLRYERLSEMLGSRPKIFCIVNIMFREKAWKEVGMRIFLSREIGKYKWKFSTRTKMRASLLFQYSWLSLLSDSSQGFFLSE